MSLFNRWTSALEQLRAQGRFRQFREPQGIDFTSNDYLGYGSDRAPLPKVSTLPQTGMASRLLRGHHVIWEEVESKLAAWHGGETALMMTSGYAANEGLISTLMEPGDWVATDELNHACIGDGLRLARCRRFAFRHNDLAHLEEGLKAEFDRAEEGRERFIITESLFSMDGDLAPLKEIADLAQRYGAHLIVDEAHSTGCYGKTGAGCIDEAGVRDKVLASMHTGGKAMGVPGAYLVGSKLFKEYMTNRCRHLIFTTAMPAAVGEWWRDRLPQIASDEEGRRELHDNATFFRGELARVGVEAIGDTYVVPVIVGEDTPSVAAATKLQQQGFDVRAIRPPTVKAGTSRLRISVHANHTQPLLSQLASAIAEAMRHG